MKNRIVIEQHLGHHWVELIIIDAKDGSTKDQMISIADALTEKMHDNESIYVTKKNGSGVVINKINGPIRVNII